MSITDAIPPDDGNAGEGGPRAPLLETSNNLSEITLPFGLAGSNETRRRRRRRDGTPHGGNNAADDDCCVKLSKLLLAPLMDEEGKCLPVVMGLTAIGICGAVIGVVIPKADHFNGNTPPYYATISSCIGYIYFLAWSISFYPQVMTNFRRRTTTGLSVEFCALNVVGFACYAVYNAALYFSPTVRGLYRQRNPDAVGVPVESNDVAFAIHAFVLSLVTLVQIGWYDGFTSTQQPSRLILAVILLIVTIAVVGASLVMLGVSSDFDWLDYIYLLSYCKIGVTLIKYIPQAFLNWKRSSTHGWSIWQILLDLTGGVLSNLQLVLDCWALNDWTGVTGNLPKLLLGQTSIFFDVIFCTQHYILYPLARQPVGHGISAYHATDEVPETVEYNTDPPRDEEESQII